MRSADFRNVSSGSRGTRGVRGGADSWCTALQAGRSRVRFPMGSKNFHWLCPSSRTMCPGSNGDRNEYQGSSLEGKGGRCAVLTTLPPSCADCLDILGNSTSWSPEGLDRPVMGQLLHIADTCTFVHKVHLCVSCSCNHKQQFRTKHWRSFFFFCSGGGRKILDVIIHASKENGRLSSLHTKIASQPIYVGTLVRSSGCCSSG